MYYVGIDVHQKSSSLEILDCNGKLFKRREVKGRWPVLHAPPTMRTSALTRLSAGPATAGTGTTGGSQMGWVEGVVD